MGKKSEKLLSMKLSVSLGHQLQHPSYRLSSAYTRGFSQARLAQELKKDPDYSAYNTSTLEHAVRCALVGNEDSNLGPVYKGNMPRDIYDEHSRRHRHDSGVESGLLRVKEKRGIHSFNRDKLQEFALKAAQARGETIWSREEIAKAMGLALLEMFKMNGQVSYGSIAHYLNEEFYDGKKVRTNVSVREALRRLQRSFSK